MQFATLRQLAGMASSTYAACQFAHLFVRAIYDALASYQRQFRSAGGFSLRTGLRNKRVKLNKPTLKELRFWATLSDDFASSQLTAPACVTRLYTDASTDRWGAVLVTAPSL